MFHAQGARSRTHYNKITNVARYLTRCTCAAAAVAARARRLKELLAQAALVPQQYPRPTATMCLLCSSYAELAATQPKPRQVKQIVFADTDAGSFAHARPVPPQAPQSENPWGRGGSN